MWNYFSTGLNIFQSTEPRVLYQKNPSKITLLSNSINDMEHYEYTTPSTDPKDKVSITEVTRDIFVDTGSKESLTKLENSISGALVINPNFFGVAAGNSETGDEDPTDFMNILNIFGYAGEISEINRKKRSQQNDNADAVIAAPSKLDENCDKNISSKNGNINSETELVSGIKGIEKDAEDFLQLQQSNNGSERSSSERQREQEASTKKTDAAQGEITSSSNNGNHKLNTHSAALEDTTSVNDQREGRRLPVGGLARETMDHENVEQNNKQKDTELLQASPFPFDKKLENKDIEPENISIPTTESTRKEKTQFQFPAIQISYARINRSEDVSLTTKQTDNYEEVEQNTTPKEITDNILVGKTDPVQNKQNSFSENRGNTSNIEIFHSVQSEYQATPITKPGILKQTQSTLNEQGKAMDNSTHSSDEPVDYEYVESKELDYRDTDDINDSIFLFESNELSSANPTTIQPHVDLDYTADVYYEQERNSTHHISSQSVPNISTVSYHAFNSKYSTKSTESNPSSVSSNKPTDEINLQMKFRATTESNSNAASIVSEAIHTTVTFDSSTITETSDTNKDINQNLKLEQPSEDILGMKERTSSKNQGKQNVEASFTEQMQSSQMKENQYPCSFPQMNYPMPPPQYYYPPYPPYPPYPYPPPSNDQLKILDNPFSRQQGPILIVNPPVMNYVPPYFPQVGSSLVDYNRVNQIQSVDPKGQYYMCNAIPAPLPNIVTVPAVEVRKIYASGLVNRERYANNYSIIL